MSVRFLYAIHSIIILEKRQTNYWQEKSWLLEEGHDIIMEDTVNCEGTEQLRHTNVNDEMWVYWIL